MAIPHLTTRGHSAMISVRFVKFTIWHPPVHNRSGFHLPPKKHTGRWIGDFKSPLVEKYHVVRCYGPASRSGRVPRIDSTVVLTRIKHSLKGIILFICSRLPFRAIYRPKVHSPHTLLSLHVSIVTATSPSPCEQRR